MRDAILTGNIILMAAVLNAPGLPVPTRHETDPEVERVSVIYIKASGAETVAASKARNIILESGCFKVTSDQQNADAVLEVSSDRQGGTWLHVPFTGQKIYTSATLFDRRTGAALWSTDRSDKWFASPPKAGKSIARAILKAKGCS